MKNTLGDLNNHLFAQLEKLGDDDLTGDAIKNIGQYYTGLYYIRRNSQKYSGEPVQNRKKELYLKKYNFFEKKSCNARKFNVY